MGWGGEAYESMAVRGVGKPRLRFQKRLARCPSQCVRYSAAQPLQPLLPSGELPGGASAGACGACGGPRRLEAQLMPALIHFFGEGVVAESRMAEALSDWDWTTVLMSTCEKGCEGGGGAGGVGWVREGVVLQSSEEGEALRKLLKEDGGAIPCEE